MERKREGAKKRSKMNRQEERKQSMNHQNLNYYAVASIRE